jgi:hypothetical protein
VVLVVIAAVVVAAAIALALVTGSAPPGPHYASPGNVCRLVRSATLAKYLPGPDASPGSTSLNAVGDPIGPGVCMWYTASGSLTVDVNVYPAAVGNATAAQPNFNSSVQAADHGITTSAGRMTVTGKRPVTGLGDQATALLLTDYLSSQGNDEAFDDVNLFVWSGNAVINVEYSVPLPSAEQIPGATAVARDVLNGLPRA